MQGWHLPAAVRRDVELYQWYQVDPDGTVTPVRPVMFYGTHVVDGQRRAGRHSVAYEPAVGDAPPRVVGLDDLPRYVDDPEAYSVKESTP